MDDHFFDRVPSFIFLFVWGYWGYFYCCADNVLLFPAPDFCQQKGISDCQHRFYCFCRRGYLPFLLFSK